jgi:hypothetical protein
MAAGAPVLGGPAHIVSVTLGRVVADEGGMQIHDWISLAERFRKR